MSVKKTSAKKVAAILDHPERAVLPQGVDAASNEKIVSDRAPMPERVASGLPLSPICFVDPATLTPSTNNTFSSMVGDRWTAFRNDVPSSGCSSTPADVLSGLLDQARQRLKTDTPERISADLLVGLQGAGLISSRRIDETRPVNPGRIGSIRQYLKTAIQRLRNAL